eukprot:26871_1
MEASPAIDSLLARVEASEHINDIQSLINKLPIEAVKVALTGVIGSLTGQQARGIVMNIESIDSIFSKDIITHIMSFADNLNMKCVNRTWNHSYKCIGKRQRKCQMLVIDKTYKIESPQSHEKATVWLMHKSRRELTPHETEAGYSGPYDSLSEVRGRVSVGDRMILHDGIWGADYVGQPPQDAWEDIITNLIEIRGIGNDVIVYMSTLGEPIWIQELTIKNVQLTAADGIQVGDSYSFDGDVSDDDEEW